MAEPIKNITIVGGGTSGWFAACYLARLLATRIERREISITLIESPDVGIIGVGESTARPIAALIQLIGISESEFIRRCDATFKLGGMFSNWDIDENGKSVDWVNPFFSQTDIQGVNPACLYSTYAMHRGGGPIEGGYTESISVCPDLIRSCKGPRAIGAKDYKSEIPYSYHINAIELAKMLAERGRELGVIRIVDHVDEVKLDERGFVSELTLKSNDPHKVDFIIDATGFASVIIGKALGEPFIPYDKYLLNDRAAVAQLPHANPTKIEPTSRATGMNAGWSFHVPLYNRVGSGYIYSSQFLSDDEAISEFKAYAGPAASDIEPRIIRMRIGKVRRSWVKNCVALGLSSGFVEPLEATAIYSVQVALQWLFQYFPDRDFDPSVRRKYNQLIDGFYEEIVDFISLLFCISNREDTPYWRAVRNDMEIPPRLKENLELWRHKMPDENDLGVTTFFTPTSYSAALMGKGFYKGRDYPQSSPIPKALWQQYLDARRARTAQFMTSLPDHYTLLRAIRDQGDVKPLNFGAGFLTSGGF